MASPLDGMELPLHCPKCRKQFSATIGQLKREGTVYCPACLTLFHGEDVAEELAMADFALSQFLKTFQ